MNIKEFIAKYELKFIFLYVLLSFIFFRSFITERPLNTHVWRQADCLSLTKHYYDGASFLEPEMHIQLGDKLTSGRSAGEFPILYYSVAQIWKVFGVSYFSYRFFFFIILSLGIFAFYKSLKIIFENEFWATVLSLLLFTSPVLIVYGVSFVTDGPAFAFNLIALYFLTLYVKKDKTKLFYYAMLFFALAGLIKVSALIIFIFLGFIFLLERFPVFTLGSRKLFPKWQAVFGFALVFLSLFAWYGYAHFYNLSSGFKYTFNDIHPIWLMNAEQEMTVLNKVKEFSSHVFYSRPMILSIFFLLFFNLFLLKKIPLFAYLANIVISLGVIIYFILWAPLMGVHDYYYVSVLVVFIGVIIPFVYYLKINQIILFEGKITKRAVLLFFAINFIICLSTVKLKTNTTHGDHVLLDSSFVKEMKWFNGSENSKWENFDKIKYLFKDLNIRKEDKVISMSDVSFNASLYFMDRKGWTNFSAYSTIEQIDELKTKGAKFLFIQEVDLKGKEFLSPCTQNQIGKYKDILIFEL